MNKKVTSKSMGSLAYKILKANNSSSIQKTLAGAVLSQRNKNNQTGAKVEDIASRILRSERYNDISKSLAASLLSQSNKER
jgi:hypothetical protein